jgi:hypothetical protein
MVDNRDKRLVFMTNALTSESWFAKVTILVGMLRYLSLSSIVVKARLKQDLVSVFD